MFSKKLIAIFYLRRELFLFSSYEMERRWNYKSMNNKMTSNGE